MDLPKRKGFRSRFRRKSATTSIIAVALVSLSVPALASADVVSDLLDGLGLGGLNGQQSQPQPQGTSGDQAAGGSDTAADTRGGTPPDYTPPLHGANPHAMGDVATVDLPPNQGEPVSGEPNEPELIIVGRSEGEQNPDGSYHGHINIVSVAGFEPLPIDTGPGENEQAALDPINSELLNPLCMASGNQVCLGLLVADSTTSDTGSQNTFQVASVNLGAGAITSGVASSSGSIAQDANCQTATGTSDVANVSIGGGLIVGAPRGSSTSTACNDGSQSVTQESEVLNLGGVAVPLPAAGCADGTPNTTTGLIPGVADTVCNASDENGAQTTAPYGVREGLTAFVLSVIPGGLAKVTTAGPESHAVAPPAVVPPVVNPPGNPGGGPGGGGGGGGGGAGGGGGGDDGDNGGGAGGGAAAGEAQAGRDNLAFTGANLALIAILGIGLLSAGLGVAAVTGSSRRPRLQG